MLKVERKQKEAVELVRQVSEKVEKDLLVFFQVVAGGFYGGASGWRGAGGGSGYIAENYLKKCKTLTSTHTGNGECKITLLDE